ncbi:MAG TPA: DUF6056 family protein [Bacteroidia bacterium]|nr:DUF6056 family protein [Bacteroidia bacterium]
MKNKNIISFVIVLASVLSLLFFFVLFSSVRCEPDEMVAGMNFRASFFLEVYRNNYLYDTFRPMYPLFSYFGVGLTNNTNYYPLTFLIIYIFISCLFIYSVYKLLQQVFTFQKLTFSDKLLLVCFSILLLMSLYFITTNRLEIFGWLSASITHLVPIVFVFTSTYFLIKEHKKLDYLYLSVCVFFIGGAAEHIAPSVVAIIVSCSLLFFYGKKNKREAFQEHKELFLKLAFFSAILTLFFLFTLVTPGAWYRYYNTQQYVKIHSPERSLEILNIIKLLCRPYKLIAFGFLVFTWVLFTKIFQVKLRMTIPWKYLLASLIAVTITTCVFCVFAYKTLNVDRMWFVFDVTLFIVASILILQFISARNLNFFLTYFGTAYLLLTVTLFDVRHIPALYKFSTEHDKIINNLQQQKEGELIEIDSFPPHDLITQTGITSDPENHFNVLFCKFYNIKARVSVKHPYNE